MARKVREEEIEDVEEIEAGEWPDDEEETGTEEEDDSWTDDDEDETDDGDTEDDSSGEASPAPAKTVMMFNGISSTDYNTMRRNGNTPRKHAVNTFGPIIGEMLRNGTADKASDELIQAQIDALWSSGGLEFEDRTTYVWTQNISAQARTRLFNSIREAAVTTPA